MSALLAALLLAATPQTAQKAKELASRGEWEELYLAFATGNPSDVPESERGPIAAALGKGCEALLKKDDAVMAFSLGERAVLYTESSPALKCLARSALKTDQRSAADAALRKGLERYPKEGFFALELGRMLLDDKDAAGAMTALGMVPPKSKEAAEAKKLVRRAEAQTTEESVMRRELERIQEKLNGDPKAPRRIPGTPDVLITDPAVGHDEGSTRPASFGYESSEGPDGMRIRANKRFAIRYFNNNRNFGERADYEGQVVQSLEESYDFVEQTLGVTRKERLDVILYTVEEFAKNLGGGLARQAAGVYYKGAIRINDAAKLTPEAKSTLTHEYVHAVLDDLCGGQASNLPVWLNEGLAEYIEWRSVGDDEPKGQVSYALTMQAQGGRLPKLQEMVNSALLSQRDPAAAYGVSALAVRELSRRGGMPKLMSFIREVGRGMAAEKELQVRYGLTVEKLNSDVHETISAR